ncbi:dihydropyrimidinase [candidate division KSB1 bacterium]
MFSPGIKLIKGGTVVSHSDVTKKDMLIEGEKISAVGELNGVKADVVIDASGYLILPGAIDTHVHFDDVFMNTVSVHDYYKGTLAAAYGGVTSVIDFSNQIVGKPLLDTLTGKKKDAEGKAIIDYGVHPVITKAAPDILGEIQLLVNEGAPTFKCYMTYRKEGLLIEGNVLADISEHLKNAGGMLLVHAEDNDTLEENISKMVDSGNVAPIYHAKSRPREAENKAITNCIEMIRKTGGRLFVVHLASDEGLEIIKNARTDGLDVFAETCTHYLVFTEDILKREDGIKWICSPPLRDKTVQKKLWQGLKDGSISMVTSDDAAYSWDAKLMGKDRFDECPNGIAGIEPRLHILYSEGVVRKRLTLSRFVELVSANPAKLFGLWPDKGNLDPGADADIVLFDPEEKWIMGQDTMHMAADYCPYEGIEITGKIKKVLSRGEVIIDGDLCLAEKGRGRYLFRKLNPGLTKTL